MEYRIETDSREKKSAKKRMSFIRRRPFKVQCTQSKNESR
ncbi:conserved hypothetical protein [Burkholderia multivorans CGD1]|nr:conserved hypothetical protein [Burkholderia multivorans CGD1]